MLDLSSRKVYGALAEQCVGGDAKADKVETAVAGHLAGLDSNGNLTDSGVKLLGISFEYRASENRLYGTW